MLPNKTDSSQREYSRADNILETWHDYTCYNQEESLLFFKKDLLKRSQAESGTKHCYMELCLH